MSIYVDISNQLIEKKKCGGYLRVSLTANDGNLSLPDCPRGVNSPVVDVLKANNMIIHVI